MKTLLALALALLASPALADSNGYFVMQDSVTVSVGSARVSPQGSKLAFQVAGRTYSGNGAATVVIYGSNDGGTYISLGSVSLTLSTSAYSGGFTSDSAWRFYKSSVTVISGTGAAAWVYLSSKL